MILCLVCNNKVLNKKSLSIHIKKFHSLTAEKYTFIYLFQKNHPICTYSNCSNKVSYSSFGYKKYCHINHRLITKNQINKKIDETTLKLEHTKNITIIKFSNNNKQFRKNRITYKCNVCGHIQSKTIKKIREKRHRCIKCVKENINLCESKIRDYLKSKLSQHEITIRDKTVITPKEIDIFVPSENFGIEYHGIYWHSNKFVSDKLKHLKKYNVCVEKGITLYQFFGDEWSKKENICINAINNFFLLNNNIDFKHCVVKKNSYKNVNKFINENALENLKNIGDKTLCVYNKNKLICLCLFENEYECIKQIVFKNGFYIQNIVQHVMSFLNLSNINMLINKSLDNNKLYDGLIKKVVSHIEPKMFYVNKKTMLRTENAKEGVYKLWDAGYYVCELS